MANRASQSKMITSRRRGKKLPAKFRAEYIPVPTQGVDRTRDDLVKLAAYAHRAQSGTPMMFLKGTTTFEDAERAAREAYVESMFPVSGRLMGEPRRKALQHRLELLKDVPVERKVLIEETWCSKEYMFWNDQGLYFIIEENIITRTITRSFNYPSREAVLQARQEKWIAWKKPVKLEPETG